MPAMPMSVLCPSRPAVLVISASEWETRTGGGGEIPLGIGVVLSPWATEPDNPRY